MAGDPKPASWQSRHWAALQRVPSIHENIRNTQRLIGYLLASGEKHIQDFAHSLQEALHGHRSFDLEDMLGIKPKQGSTLNAPRIIHQAIGDANLLKLSKLAGGDRAAVLLLKNPEQAPKNCRTLITEIHREGWATSYAAFGRARKRSKKPDQLIADEPTNPKPEI